MDNQLLAAFDELRAEFRAAMDANQRTSMDVAQRITALERYEIKASVDWKTYVDTRLTATETAVNKAEEQLRQRLEGMNEFRGQLKDQAATLATREALDLTRDRLRQDLERLTERLGAVEKVQANQAGRSWMLITGLGIGLTILSLALRLLVP